MNKIFSAAALAATVITLTLASADVLASNGKGNSQNAAPGNSAGKGNSKTVTQPPAQTTSAISAPGNSAGKGNGADKSKGHDHTHSNGVGHTNHQGNGYGHN
ncbi:MAG: hypothetical protein Q8K97_03110, partial [Pseudohongiella sp.]|nr:hypothetical protein [Pseudohongiella sp.]